MSKTNFIVVADPYGDVEIQESETIEQATQDWEMYWEAGNICKLYAVSEIKLEMRPCVVVEAQGGSDEAQGGSDEV